MLCGWSEQLTHMTVLRLSLMVNSHDHSYYITRPAIVLIIRLVRAKLIILRWQRYGAFFVYM